MSTINELGHLKKQQPLHRLSTWIETNVKNMHIKTPVLLYSFWFHDLIWRQMEPICVMQLVTAGGTGCVISPRHDAKASKASLGLLGARS